ncbi:unnamed protein product [Brassicogethes aeneus]|uniref:Fanconi anemia group I protein n=1 Tax=Brassicogethes aeneus TaxID=1431903 RepID=A0A9P0B7B6_BRAAE|nr:unnamed protein product [Brassicogethes aeneus]
MAQLSDKIREYGLNRDVKQLEKLVNDTDVTDLLNLVKNKVKTFNFNYTWNYLLQGLAGANEEKRFKLALCLLNEIEQNDIPSNLSNTLINRLCMDINKFKSEHLAELCNFCKNSIQSKNTLHMSWKDLLPEVLNVLIEREHIEHNDIEYTGPEFKTTFIDTLCMTDWSPNIITSLTSMFIEMPLTKDEHLKVVNKLGMYIEKLTPLEVPAFIHQILKLCKNNSIRSIFLKLQNYFGVRIYEQNIDSDNNSDSTVLDEIESSSSQDTIEAESTVLYHIHTSASLGHECIQDYISSLKNLLKSPEYILHPFQLTLLFTIATISHYEDTIFELIRPAIVRCYQEEIKKNNSSWYKEMIPTNFKVEDVFGKVIHFSLTNRDLTLQAMVNFAFVLLRIGSGLGRDAMAERQWIIGNMILLKIIKRKRNIAPNIIQMLSNNIVTGHNVTQYIECLYILSRSFPLLMIENQSCIVEMMESLSQMPGPVANQLLDAITPLTKVSPTIRDHLIILLRKSLYSRILGTRQMAVSGFLKLLSIMKISSLAILSQSTSSTGSFTSGHSLFTQLSLNRSSQSTLSSFSNEALCLEVLSILKRCFMQQAEVKAKLYEGLYDTVCTNLELGLPVLDVMCFHLQELYVTDEEQLPPLKFDNIVAIRDVEAVLQEPLGKLIYASGLTVCKMAETEADNQTVINYQKMLDSLCKRMIQCELVHFDLDDGTDLLDILPECQKKGLILKEALNVYEALIGYKILSWCKDSENIGQEINNLFQGYSRLYQFSKNLLKPKKDARKKNQNNRATQNNTDINTQRKEQKVKNIKMPDSLWSNKTIVRALELLHENDVDWVGPGKANVIKTKREFHQHVMQATINIVQNIKHLKNIDSNVEQKHYDTLVDISVIIYNRIIKRFNEFIDFDCTTAVLALECFQYILHRITTQYKSNFRSFIKKICKQDEPGENTNHLREIVHIYQKLFEIDEDEASGDPEIKKLSNFAITTLALLSNQITYKDNHLIIQFYEWLKNLAYNNNVSHKVSIPFSNLLFEVHVKSRASLTLMFIISVYLGDVIGVITEEEHDSEKLEFINEGTVHNVFLSLCACIKGQLEDIDSIINRLKSEFYMITYPGQENIERKRDYLKNKETGVCCQLCFIVTILTNLSNISLQPGNITEAIFKNLTALFCTLTSLTKYFMMRSSKSNAAFRGARFERLVKLAGKQLAPVVYTLILYVEETQKQQAENTQGKKKSVDSSTLKSKVLRETRMIPKVVYEMEQFSKTVTQLSNKTKVDLTRYVGQGIVRDFRILKLKEVLERAETSFVSTQQTDINTTNQDVSMASASSDQEHDSEGESSPPPSKKNKK